MINFLNNIEEASIQKLININIKYLRRETEMLSNHGIFIKLFMLT